MAFPPKKPYYLRCPKCGWRDATVRTDLIVSHAKKIFQDKGWILACPKCDTPLLPKEETLLDKILNPFYT